MLQVVERGRSIARPPRVFATRRTQPRSRRATDVLVLVAALLTLALIAIVAVPPLHAERWLDRQIARLPHDLDVLWRVVADLVIVFALAVAIRGAIARRWTLLRDMLLAGLLALGLALIAGEFASGNFSSISAAFSHAGHRGWAPALRIALPGAVTLVALPHLSLPFRRLGRWLLGLCTVATILLADATVTAALAGLLVALIAATAIHLALGSVSGRPGLAEVTLGLEALGLTVTTLGPAERQPAGVFVVDAVDELGTPLTVKVYGRDAQDTQLLTTLAHKVWYREAGAPVYARRLEQVEHEAFLTLLAAQAGVATDRVVTAATTVNNDVLLVLATSGATLDELPAPPPRLERRIWDVVAQLHGAGIAHGQLDDRSVLVAGDELGVRDFRGGAAAPPLHRRRSDQVQALMTAVLATGTEPALGAAADALGPEVLATLLPLLQLRALTPRQQPQVRTAKLDLDAVRAEGAQLAGIEPPQLQRLTRVTRTSVLRLALFAFAFFALVSAVSDFDFAHLGHELKGAHWWLVILGFLVAQLPRLAQAVALMGAAPVPLPLGPLYALQLTHAYVGLAVPTMAGRVAVNIRFFQRRGLTAGTALAVGALDGAFNFIVQIVMLLVTVLFTAESLQLHVKPGSPERLGFIAIGLAVAGVIATALIIALPRVRERILARVRDTASDARESVRGLASVRRIGLLVGGNVVSETLLAAALAIFAAAFAHPVTFAAALVVNLSVGIVVGILPVPGGIGVYEAGLTVGLAGAGMPDETAFAAALMYRLSTFYLPPIWGAFAMRWMERNRHL